MSTHSTNRMWNCASKAFAGSIKIKNESSKLGQAELECSDDEPSSCKNKEEGLECPICWESFNIVENIPYVLWCGHTLCKNCVMGLQWAVVKFSNLPVQLPLFIACPWCQLLSFRLVYKGVLKFPRKNFFLLWMVESMNEGTTKSSSYQPAHASNYRNVAQHVCRDHSDTESNHLNTTVNYWNLEWFQSSLGKSLVFFIHLTAKFPLVIIFLLVIIYAVPASAVILVLYMLVTVLLALPSFLMLYFAYPTLDWLVREIMT